MSDEHKIAHTWGTMVIPINLENSLVNYPFLIAHCRNCNSVFTQRIPTVPHHRDHFLSKIDLPKWGCVNPAEGL